MPIADRVYVDPSALRSLYVHDGRSRAFCAWSRRAGGALILTHLGYGEMVNAIALAAFRRDIDRATAAGAIADLDRDIAEDRIQFVDLPWRRMMDRAAALSRAHTPELGTRTLDVLHVAAALVLERTVFATYDVRQSRLASAVGLRVLRP